MLSQPYLSRSRRRVQLLWNHSPSQSKTTQPPNLIGHEASSALLPKPQQHHHCDPVLQLTDFKFQSTNDPRKLTLRDDGVKSNSNSFYRPCRILFQLYYESDTVSRHYVRLARLVCTCSRQSSSDAFRTDFRIELEKPVRISSADFRYLSGAKDLEDLIGKDFQLKIDILPGAQGFLASSSSLPSPLSNAGISSFGGLQYLQCLCCISHSQMNGSLTAQINKTIRDPTFALPQVEQWMLTMRAYWTLLEAPVVTNTKQYASSDADFRDSGPRQVHSSAQSTYGIVSDFNTDLHDGQLRIDYYLTSRGRNRKLSTHSLGCPCCTKMLLSCNGLRDHLAMKHSDLDINFGTPINGVVLVEINCAGSASSNSEGHQASIKQLEVLFDAAGGVEKIYTPPHSGDLLLSSPFATTKPTPASNAKIMSRNTRLSAGSWAGSRDPVGIELDQTIRCYDPQATTARRSQSRMPAPTAADISANKAIQGRKDPAAESSSAGSDDNVTRRSREPSTVSLIENHESGMSLRSRTRSGPQSKQSANTTLSQLRSSSSKLNSSRISPSTLSIQPETDPKATRTVASGKQAYKIPEALSEHVTYFRSISKMPIQVGELLEESDDEVDDTWIRRKQENDLSSMSHLSAEEKKFMQRFNRHFSKDAVVGDRNFVSGWTRFVQQNASFLHDDSMLAELLKRAAIAKMDRLLSDADIIRSLDLINNATASPELTTSSTPPEWFGGCICGKVVDSVYDSVTCWSVVSHVPRNRMYQGITLTVFRTVLIQTSI